jgi:hypothetical protein
LPRVHELVQDLRKILEIQLADTVKARRIFPDGRSVRGKGGRPPGPSLPGLALRGSRSPRGDYVTGPLSPPSSCHGSDGTGT